MCLGGVCRWFVRMESSSVRFGLSLLVPSAGLIAPVIRHMECKRDSLTHSRQL